MFTQTMKRVLQLSCTVVLSSYIFLYVAVAQDEQEKYFPLLTRKEGVRTFVPQPIPQTSPNQIQQKITDVVYDDTTTFSRIDIGLKGVFTGDALWFDYDNDGDLDAIVAGWDDTSYITTIYNNQAGAFIDIGADIEGIGTERGLSWGDYDRDGDIDFAITGRTDTMALNPVSRIYRNENGQFTDIRANLMQLNGGSVAWADYDRDGDLDLFLSGSPDIGRTFYSLLYRNDAPYRSEKDTFTNVNAGFPGVWGSFVDWGDYDNDDDLDLLLTGYGDLGQTVLVFRNDGKEGFHNANINLPRMNSGMVSWADYDNDKDLDIALAGCISSGALSKIFRNDGNDIFIDIGAQLKPLCHSAVAWGDYDSDGDLDLAMSGGERYWYGTNPTTKLYRNDSGTFVDTDIRLKGTWYGSLTWGDVDNDGALDLLVTGGTIPMPYYYYHGPYYPITYLYQNKYPRKNTRPETPGSSNVSIDNDRVSLTWSTANDGETPSNALTYNLRIGTTPGGTDIVAPSSNVQTGFRRMPKKGNSGYTSSWSLNNLPAGTYYWSVQTVDNEYAGSVFTAEQSFVISPTGVPGEEELPERITLVQNYPNPFNPSTVISYRLSVHSSVSLTVYNLLGEEITTLVNETQDAGFKSVEWNVSGLPSGVYVARLIVGNTVQTKAMLLMK